MNEVLNFLTFLHEKAYEYSSVNCQRPAIYAYHIHVNNNLIGQQLRACAFLSVPTADSALEE